MTEETQWQDTEEIVFRNLLERLSKLDSQISDLSKQLISINASTKPQNASLEREERIAEIEVKIKKLWDMLTEETPRGRPKLSAHGKIWKERLGR